MIWNKLLTLENIENVLKSHTQIFKRGKIYNDSNYKTRQARNNLRVKKSEYL